MGQEHYWTSNAYTGSNSSVQFERLGHPGAYTSVKKFTGGQLDLTGSNFGYGAVVVKEGSLATASLSGGGDVIGLSELSAGVVYDLSISKISGSVAAVPKVYLFKRQQ